MKPAKQSIYAVVCMFLIFGQITSTFAYTIEGDAVRNSEVVGSALGSLDRLIYGDREALPVQLKNVAQGKPATQSSTVFGAAASRAVDGNTFGRWSGRSVTHTALDGVDPWWQVDLGGFYDISEIKIFKRSDCCLQVFDNFRILYSDRPIDSNAKEYVGLQRATNATFHSFKKSAKKVRYVRITLKGKKPLYMAEVQVFGVPASSASTATGSIVNASSVEYGTNKFIRLSDNTWRQGPVAAKITWTETKRDSSTIYLSRRNPNSGQEQRAELNIKEKKILIYSRAGFAPTGFTITKVVGLSTTSAPKNSASACSLSDWAGTWNTSFQEVMWTIQSDGSLTGTYQPAKHKLIAKPVAGNPCVLEGTWKQPNSSGRIRFTMNADKRSFKGLWSYGTADPKSNWSGTLKARAPVARTTAPAPKTNRTAVTTNVPEVKFFSRNNLSLAQAKSIAVQNGWQLATTAQVTAAWQNRGLNAFAYARTSDGSFCVPIQHNNGSFTRGTNCGVTGGNQGFLYVQKTTNSTASPVDVKFYPSTGITLAEARRFAAKKGWQIATPEQVAAAWRDRGLQAFAYARTSDGKFCVPLQQSMGNFERGINCGVTGGNQGFLYVDPSAPVSTNKRSGYIDIASQWAKEYDSPTTIGTKYAFRRLILIWNKSVQHPSQSVYGLGDAVMLREAAELMLRSLGRPVSNATIDSVLTPLKNDPAARYRFAPYLLKVTYEALSTPNPDAGQLAFRKNFEAYMGLWRFEQALDTLNRWNSFKKENVNSQIKPHEYGPTAGNFLPMRPADAQEFLKTHTNPMLLGSKGRDAVRLLLEPAAAASLPEFRNSGLSKLGADLDAVAYGLGTGTTVATSAATLGLVSTAVLSGTGVTGLSTTVTAGATTAAGVATAPVTTSTATSGPMAKIILASGKLAGFTLPGAAALGIAIAIALAVVIGVAIARQAISDQTDRRLKAEFDRGFDPVDVYRMINDRDTSKRIYNRSAVFGFLLKMLIADPADRGLLTLRQPAPNSVTQGLRKPGVVTVRHQGGYVSDVTLTYLDGNRRTKSVVRKARPVGQVDRFEIPAAATNVRLSIVMYTGLAGAAGKVTLIDRILRPNELRENKCFTTVGTTIVGRGLKEGACDN